MNFSKSGDVDCWLGGVPAPSRGSCSYYETLITATQLIGYLICLCPPTARARGGAAGGCREAELVGLVQHGVSGWHEHQWLPEASSFWAWLQAFTASSPLSLVYQDLSCLTLKNPGIRLIQTSGFLHRVTCPCRSKTSFNITDPTEDLGFKQFCRAAEVRVEMQALYFFYRTHCHIWTHCHYFLVLWGMHLPPHQPGQMTFLWSRMGWKTLQSLGFLSLALTPEAPRSLRWGTGSASGGQLPLPGHRQDGNGNERPCRRGVHARPFPFAGSYYLTTTYGALEHIKNYDKITVTRQLSMEVQDSIHRWERRRTLNKARASRSSVQVPRVTGRETAWEMDGLCPYLLISNMIIILRQNQLTLLLKRRVHNMQTPQWLVSCEVHTRGSVEVSPKATSQFCRDFTVQSWTLQTPRWKPGERLLSGRRGPGSHIEACCLLPFTYCSQNCL